MVLLTGAEPGGCWVVFGVFSVYFSNTCTRWWIVCIIFCVVLFLFEQDRARGDRGREHRAFFGYAPHGRRTGNNLVSRFHVRRPRPRGYRAQARCVRGGGLRPHAELRGRVD